MSLEAVEAALEARTNTLFELVSGVPVDYGQGKFDKPDGTPWVRHTILSGLDVSVEVDATSYEISGSLEIQIFTKQRRENTRIYDQLAQIYRQQEFSGIYTLSPERIVSGLRDGWWQATMSVEWETTIF